MTRLVALLLALSGSELACSSSSTTASGAPDGGGLPDVTTTVDDGAPSNRGADATKSYGRDGSVARDVEVDTNVDGGDAASGPQLMARLANYVYPTFHNFDMCLGTEAAGATSPTYTAPVARNVYQTLHLAQFGKVGPYLSVAAGATWVRLVEAGTSSCDDVIADLPDVKLPAPLSANTWVTLLAYGNVDPIDGQVGSPLKIDPLMDQPFSSTAVSVRVLSFDPEVSSVKVGYVDQSKAFQLIVDKVTYGPPGSGYVPTTSTAFCTGLEVEPEDGGTAIGTLGQLCGHTGGWTVFVPPPAMDGIIGCQDGVAGPRLCVPCGLQSCTGS